MTVSVLGDLDALRGHEARCVGALLGSLCGDTLGQPEEGHDWKQIAERHKPRGLVDWPHPGRFTDDSEMTLALAQSLVQQGGCDAALCSAAYATAFHDDRGYAAGTARALKAIGQGVAPTETGRLSYPDGSYGNGGAMRIAPVGLAYRHAGRPVLRAAVEAALLCTHVHPDAIEGAEVQARAVAALSLSLPSGQGPAGCPGALLQYLALATGKDSTMHRHVIRLKEALFQAGGAANVSKASQESQLLLGAAEEAAQKPDATTNWEGDAASLTWQEDLLILDDVADMRNQIHACDAVACAVWAMCRHWHHPQAAIIAAARYGGDTDTIAAMTGALAGALHGASWLPAHWWEGLELGTGGRDDVIAAASTLSKLNLS